MAILAQPSHSFAPVNSWVFIGARKFLKKALELDVQKCEFYRGKTTLSQKNVIFVWEGWIFLDFRHHERRWGRDKQ